VESRELTAIEIAQGNVYGFCGCGRPRQTYTRTEGNTTTHGFAPCACRGRLETAAAQIWRDAYVENYRLKTGDLYAMERWAHSRLVRFFFPNVSWIMRCLLREVREHREEGSHRDARP
jgi:hypothetical protein